MEGFTGYVEGAAAISPAAQPGFNTAKSALGGLDSKSEPTALTRIYERFAQSNMRMRDMLGAMESRLDFANGGPVPQTVQGAGSAPTPPAQPGTVEALHEMSRNFHDLCNRLDGELCRMMKIL